MKNDNGERYRLNGDKPKEKLTEDKFGLSEMAFVLADGLLQQLPSEGYVIGIEGEWGSGKSSFVNFLQGAMRSRSPDCHFIRFEPWLIDQRDALLLYFFSALATKIRQVEIKDGRRKANRISKKLWAYARLASKLSTPLEKAAQLDPTGSLSSISKIFNFFCSFLGLQETSPPSLEQKKAEIERDLRAVSRSNPDYRLVIIIDDLDRLEPAEAVEILRLVTKVADFPLITYILCFDRMILAQQVTGELGIQDGGEYLKKIVQTIISLPPQEPFALRQHLTEMLMKSFSEEMSVNDLSDASYAVRRQYVFDTWAECLLKTPRDVVRLSEAIKLGWPHLKGRADFLDYVWLQAVNLGAKDLYGWVRKYLSEVGAYRDNGRAGDGEAQKMAASLSNIMSSASWEREHNQMGLTHFLPGLSDYALEGDAARVFKFSAGEIEAFENKRRLGSPSHWRQYFSFDVPSYVISDEELERFKLLVRSDASGAADLFRDFAQRPHQRPGHYARYLIDRLHGGGTASFSKEDMAGLAVVFSEVMDELYLTLGSRDEPGDGIFGRAERLLAAKGVLDVGSLFDDGKSLSWLALVLRRQGAAYGLPEGRESDIGARWISENELHAGVQSVSGRLRAMGLDIFKIPEPLTALYCWLQLGDPDDVKDFLGGLIQTPEGLVTVISGFSGVVYSSNRGIYYPIKRSYVASFFDADSVQQQLRELASSSTAPLDLKGRASAILNAWSDGNI